MKYKPYPKYKDSGIEWLGKVPQGWNVMRLKYIAPAINQKVDASQSDLKFLGMEHIESWTGKRLNGEAESSSDGLCSSYKPGDVLFGKLRPYLAKVLKVDDDGICTGELLVLRPNEIEQSFLFYQVLNRDFVSLVDASTYGTKMPRASWEFIGNICEPVPPLPEQLSIAAFLDRETSHIDELISKKEQQIELLQEKRQALISHAVTKGLNPKAKMKDSGIEWLGMVPAHWKITKLKYECKLISDGTHLPPQRTSEGIPLLSVRNMVDGKFVSLEDDSLISEQDYLLLAKSFTVMKDDVLLAIVGATLGKVAIVREMPRFHIQRSVAVFRPNTTSLNFRYLSLFFQSLPFQRFLWQTTGFSAQPGIYLEALENAYLALPPIPEQGEIIDVLSSRLAKLEQVSDLTHQSIAKLREYRTALISAAVTGKIDIRDQNHGAN